MGVGGEGKTVDALFEQTRRDLDEARTEHRLPRRDAGRAWGTPEALWGYVEDLENRLTTTVVAARVLGAELLGPPARQWLRGYRVYVMDGPAEGWGYIVSVPPDPTIAIAPMPEGASHVHGKWMRVLPDDQPQWAGARRYELAEPIPPPGEEPAERLTSDGDLLCPYRVVD
jgi:hypothetical protein